MAQYQYQFLLEEEQRGSLFQIRREWLGLGVRCMLKRVKAAQ